MSTVTLHTGGSASALPGRSPAARGLGLWLLIVAVLVFAIIVVGGITRLTESGLSMVDWRPVTGLLPPLSEDDWQEAFQAYKQYPEYRLVNRGMALAQFKTIYWWEYAHRLLGRFIGLAFFVPLFVFWMRGAIPARYKPRLLGLLLLGGAQGFLGWFMVQSGLVDRPDVSHYRLTAHLGLALILFMALLWTALDFLAARRGLRHPRLRRWGMVFLLLVFLQCLLGGMVAGLDAGLAYNSWPDMGGHFLPPLAFAMEPAWINFLENPALVQFEHRIGGYLVAIAVVLLLLRSMRGNIPAPAKMGAVALVLIVAGQVIIGVLTVLNQVPIALGALHQALAVILLAGAVMFVHMHRKDPGR